MELMRRSQRDATRAMTLALRQPRYWLAVAGISGAYVASAKLGLGLSVAQGVITPVWAPSGIALAALVLFGRRFWPAVALGAVLANATSGAEVWVAFAIAFGNTLEAVVGATLLRRAGFDATLERVRDVLALVVCGAGVGTLIAATNGVLVLFLSGNAEHLRGSDWLLWWFGDAAGILLVSPLLLVLAASRWKRPSPARLAEALVCLAALASVSALVFLAGAWRYPYLIFPLLLWATLRFRQQGAAASSFLVGAIATWGTVAGTVPFGGDATARVQVVQALVCVLAIALLVVGATLAERETADEQLRQTAAQLGEAQALSHIGSWEWDLATGTLCWSQELYSIWGIAADRFGASYEAFLETVHPEDRARVEAGIQCALEVGLSQYVFRIRRSDGAELTIQARCKRVTDQDGRPAKLIGTAQNITAQREVEAWRGRLFRQERAQNARLRELDRQKDTFLASVSHELRTPLTSIIGFVKLLDDEARGTLSAEQRNYLAIVRRNTERLERLVGDLLFFAEAGREKTMLERSRIDLRALASSCVESMAPQAQEAGVELVCTGGEVPVIEGDPSLLGQVVENLVANAIKFSPEGGRVELRASSTETQVVLAVTDRGIGIPPSEQSQVFDRFFRSSNATAQAVQGSGLGLAIAKVIVEAHGGAISLESADGEGTCVRVTLPRAPAGAAKQKSTLALPAEHDALEVGS
jgi:hypothetical protein